MTLVSLVDFQSSRDKKGAPREVRDDQAIMSHWVTMRL